MNGFKYFSVAMLTVILFTGTAVGTAKPINAKKAKAGTAQTSQTLVTHKKEVISFFSKSMNAMTTCTVFIPKPLVKDKKYPVVYMLHGYSGDHSDFDKKTSFSLAMIDKEMIAVLPDGGYSGWYLDSPKIAENRYESLIVKDVIPEIDKRYPTFAQREGRAIGGLSMGGHGAITLAAKHPDIFCSASSMSGVLNLFIYKPGEDLNITGLLGERSENEAAWKQNNAASLVDNFTSADVSLLFDCGIGDGKYFPTSVGFHELLCARGIRHTFNKYPGIHSWAYWDERLPEHLFFHYKNMTDAIAGKKRATGIAPDSTRFDKFFREKCLQFEKETAAYLADKDATSPIVLLGSSTIAGFNDKKYLPGLPVLNFGIGGDRIKGKNMTGIVNRFHNTVVALQPRAVILYIGTNDIGDTARTGKPQLRQLVATYTAFIKELRKELPDCHIYIDSAHPTNYKYAVMAPYIHWYNNLLMSYIKKSNDKKLHYIDHATAVSGPDGLLKPKYTKDGLHLNDAGNKLLGEKYLKALKDTGVLEGLK